MAVDRLDTRDKLHAHTLCMGYRLSVFFLSPFESLRYLHCVTRPHKLGETFISSHWHHLGISCQHKFHFLLSLTDISISSSAYGNCGSSHCQCFIQSIPSCIHSQSLYIQPFFLIVPSIRWHIDREEIIDIQLAKSTIDFVSVHPISKATNY